MGGYSLVRLLMVKSSVGNDSRVSREWEWVCSGASFGRV